MKPATLIAAAFVFLCMGIQTNAQTELTKTSLSHDDVKNGNIKLANTFAKSTADYLKSGGSNSKLMAAIKKDVGNYFRDPASAKFRNMVIRKYGDGSIVCGEVNAKNKYGAYIGYKRFLAGGAYSEGDDIFVYKMIEDTSSNDKNIIASINAGIYDGCPRH